MRSSESFPIWPGLPPGAMAQDPVRDIPTLTPFLPQSEEANCSAVIVCPGGGYEMLADYEGKDYGLWLAERGIAAFVLKYRLGSHGYRYPEIQSDLTRALRYVRNHAAEWGVNPDKIGVMGSSAGGHLASLALTHFDAGEQGHADPVEWVSSRPAFGILCYAVISMMQHFDPGSRRNFLGESYPSEWEAEVSGELQVKADTPPCFVWHAQDDRTVPVENALMFASALQEKEIRYALHIYRSGDHGIGLGLKGYQPGANPEKLHLWTLELESWMREQGLMDEVEAG